MKVIVILKDGRRFEDVEADDDVASRGRCEFAAGPKEEPRYPAFARTEVHHCFCLRTENGVPVFEER